MAPTLEWWELCSLCSTGPLSAVVTFLDRFDTPQQQELVNTRDEEGFSPLLAAVCKNRPDVVKHILGLSVVTHSRDACGLCLHVAAEMGFCEVAASLLQRFNAALEEKNKDGETALHVAARAGFNGLVGLLLDARADPNVESAKGYCPLHLAAANRRVETCRLLLQGGADPSLAGTRNVRTAFQLAEHGRALDEADTRFQEIVELLQARATANQHDPNPPQIVWAAKEAARTPQEPGPKDVKEYSQTMTVPEIRTLLVDMISTLCRVQPEDPLMFVKQILDGAANGVTKLPVVGSGKRSQYEEEQSRKYLDQHDMRSVLHDLMVAAYSTKEGADPLETVSDALEKIGVVCPDKEDTATPVDG